MPKRTVKTIHDTREDWMHAAVQHIRPTFDELRAPLPERLMIGVNPPPSRRSKAVGSCWPEKCSPGTRHIWISAVLSDWSIALATLVHELCHAACTDTEKHGPEFGRLARALLLEGKLTATYPGKAFMDYWTPIYEKELGVYPHVTWKAGGKPPKKTYLIKAECPACGFVVRTTEKWIDQAGGELACPDRACGTLMEID